jgi:hypothetical protein
MKISRLINHLIDIVEMAKVLWYLVARGYIVARGYSRQE